MKDITKHVTKQGLHKAVNKNFIIGFRINDLKTIKNIFNLDYTEEQKNFIVDFCIDVLFTKKTKLNFKKIDKDAKNLDLLIIKFGNHYYFINSVLEK